MSYCNNYFEIDKLTVDHIKPKAEGGNNDITNTRAIFAITAVATTSSGGLIRQHFRLH